MATPTSSAITRSSPPGPTPERCSTPGCARGPLQRGAKRLVEELDRPGAPGRGDRTALAPGRCGVLSYALIDTLVRRRGRLFDHGRINAQVRACIEAIDKSAWLPIAYPDGGMAQVAETTYVTGRAARSDASYGSWCVAAAWPIRARRPCGPIGAITPSSPTSSSTPSRSIAFHRAHANVELAIRDLKEGAGLEHCPSGHFFANAAWLACAVLAHNLIRWTASPR